LDMEAGLFRTEALLRRESLGEADPSIDDDVDGEAVGEPL